MHEASVDSFEARGFRQKMAAMVQQRHIHALLFPFPVVGHINPMLQLASSLCSTHGVKVTFLITDYRLAHLDQEKKLQENDPLFSFHAFPDGLPAEDHEGPMAALKLFGAMGKMAGSGVFGSVMQDIQSRGPPVDCIISDTFLSWTHFVAEKLGIPRVAFWTSCASSYLIHHHTPLLVAQGQLPLSVNNDSNKQMLELPGLCPLPASYLPSVMQVSDISDMAFTAFLHLFENDRKCASLIINSYTDLEPEQFKHLKDDFSSVLAIGPLLPTNLLLKKSSPQASDSRMQMLEEDHSCLQWLDSKPAASVVYVSFGSIASLGKEQLHQLALGLQGSKKNFLWVIRGVSTLDGVDLPNGFLEHTKEQGLIIGWAPQLEVLAHPSVGAFLTHCGWNSTIESLSLGVPLIGMPTDFGEQKTVAWLLEHMWNVGVELKVDSKGLVSKVEVEVAVKTVMEGQEGAGYRRNALKLSDGAKKAVLPGGSLEDSLRLLVQDMCTLK